MEEPAPVEEREESKPKKAGRFKARAASGSTTANAAGKAGSTGRGGTASILAGVAIIAPVLIRELTRDTDPLLLLPVGLVAIAVALPGIRAAQAGKNGKLGRIGMLVAALGALILAVMFLLAAYNDLISNSRLQSGDWLFTVGFALLVAGLAIFGASTLVAGVLARGPILLMMVSLPLGALLDYVGAFPGGRAFPWGSGIVLGAGLHLGMKVFGLSLIWLGYTIMRAARLKADAVNAADVETVAP